MTWTARSPTSSPIFGRHVPLRPHPEGEGHGEDVVLRVRGGGDRRRPGVRCSTWRTSCPGCARRACRPPACPSGTGTLGLVIGPQTATFGRYGSILGWLGFAFLTAWLVFRTVATGHGPFSNMYEFSVAFAWGILGAYYWFERSYHQRVLGPHRPAARAGR